MSPRWITAKDVIKANRVAVEATGEPHSILSLPGLEGAVERPAQLHHYEGEQDLVRLGVRLLFAVAAAHAFEQGNKRTAVIAMRGFLIKNGYDLIDVDSGELGDLIIEVIAGDRTEDWFLGLVRPLVRKL